MIQVYSLALPLLIRQIQLTAIFLSLFIALKFMGRKGTGALVR